MNNNFNWKLQLATLVVAFFGTLQSDAQIVLRQSIASISSSGGVSGVRIHQTVGQSYFTSGYYGNQMAIRPGFQQPSHFDLSAEFTGLELQVEVYPNPAISSFTMRSVAIMDNATVKVTDLKGKLILEKKFSSFQSYAVNCENWRNGLYIITLYDEHQNKNAYKLIINK